jgi:hypothetical protein
VSARSPVTNPFVPGSDAVPTVWAGRALELADVREVVRARRIAGVYERGRVVLGPPGIGKSVLLNRIAQDLTAAGDIVLPAVRLSRDTAPVEALVRTVRTAAEQLRLGERVAARMTAALSRFTEFSTPVGGVRMTVPETASADLRSVLVELAAIAAEQDRALVLRIDEVQAPSDRGQLSTLLVALADALAHEVVAHDDVGTPHPQVLPLIVLLSGLPSFWRRARESDATFARRLAPVLLRPLTDADIEVALAPFADGGWPVLGDAGPARVGMTADAIGLVVELALGDPFLFQLVGSAAWNAGAGAVITADDVRAGWAVVGEEAERHVSRLLDDVAPLERQLLTTMAQLGPDQRTLTSIARTMGRRGPGEVSTAARRLDIDHGLIIRDAPYRFAHRTVEVLLQDRWPR